MKSICTNVYNNEYCYAPSDFNLMSLYHEVVSSLCPHDFMFCVDPRRSSRGSASANGDPNEIKILLSFYSLP